MKPFIVSVSDYHDFKLVELGADCAFDAKIKFKEITLLSSTDEELTPYWAVFFIGKCPLKKDEYSLKELEKLGINVYWE
jgi:hypothetical protein